MRKENFLGCLLGLAVGDAVGTTIEFKRPGTFAPVTDMVGGGPFQLEPGQWTDDTSMALCLAESLLLCEGFSAHDQMKRYLRWYRDGYYSSTGDCFDIGITTRSALEHFERTGEPYAGSTDPNTAGNGSLMRLAPIAMFRASFMKLAIAEAALSSKTTHGAIEAVDACRFFASLLVGALNGVAKEELLQPNYESWLWDDIQLSPAIHEIYSGSFKQKNTPEIQGTGYVVKTLEAVLWAFYRTISFEEGLLQVVNLGDDADTTGAVYGQLAGAYYGSDAIPKQWLQKLHDRETISGLANGLHELHIGSLSSQD
ncbi:ADP-ribosylglycohydrolase [Paenibacillus dendritiformis]|uniref:ADP-ribosylglycohydrolase family protein n=1 Tax=Paenibacillus TaxID=44249 RepID=UPI001B294365|nr:ADP-ribosylglycohydrolase family protein [Paenibacillus dendritiformis]GIO81735.1 ADP-ribosylglycohydrolase [Paenibacillus dendritiformis]